MTHPRCTLPRSAKDKHCGHGTCTLSYIWVHTCAHCQRNWLIMMDYFKSCTGKRYYFLLWYQQLDTLTLKLWMRCNQKEHCWKMLPRLSRPYKSPSIAPLSALNLVSPSLSPHLSSPNGLVALRTLPHHIITADSKVWKHTIHGSHTCQYKSSGSFAFRYKPVRTASKQIRIENEM